MRPMLMMAPMATSWSASWESLDKVSITATFGFDRCKIASATGTARLSGNSPYCKMWSKDRRAISAPISSPIAIMPMPNTATAWCVASASSKCSVQAWSIFCTCSTSPEFANAMLSTVSFAYLPTGCVIASSAARVTSHASCWPKYSSPRPTAKKCGHVPLSAPSTAWRSIKVCKMACATSVLAEETKINPKLTAAIAEHSIVHAVSTIIGVKFSNKSSQQLPA
mmetsp:Transcript_101002/g.308870  ORF Transcript_101002/g.308870 Transcript_101002/m.308870 type:complete len:224 (+) Transcript_101002:563-1234(+)